MVFIRRRQQFGGQGRGGGRGGRGRGRGRGRGGRGRGTQRANVTAEDLDAELDAYHDAVRLFNTIFTIEFLCCGNQCFEDKFCTFVEMHCAIQLFGEIRF